VVAGSGGSVQTVGVRRFTGMIFSFLFRLSESEKEPESACTIRVPLGGVSCFVVIDVSEHHVGPIFEGL